MTEDLDRLDVLAAAATPGPWTVGFDKGLRNGVWSQSTVTSVGEEYDPSYLVAWCHSGTRDEADAAFIAACDPATIRSLVAAVRERDDDAKKLDAVRRWVEKQKNAPWAESGSFASRMTGEQGYDAALEEVEALVR